MLRRISTSRLLTMCALVVAATVLVGALAAGAFGGSGPVPPRKPLANAVHDALTAPPVLGVSAQVQFTNRLIDTSGVRGANILLTGASGRLWATRGHLRLELQAPSGSEGAGDVQVLVNGRSFSVLDVGSNTLYRGTLPQDNHPKRAETVPSIATIQQGIQRAAQHLTIGGPTPTDVAGRPAYSVSLSPKNGGLIGRITVAWDARKGAPLRGAVYARGGSTPVLELRATQISFGAVPASTFAINPPANVKVVNITTPAATPHAGGRKHAGVTGLAAVQAKVPFKIDAPPSLAGQSQSRVSLLGKDGALVAYGQGLAGVYVFEQKPDSQHQNALTLSKKSGGRSDRQLQLPTVQLNGATATEISTPLGTLIRFERAGVEYTVVGSVTKATAEAAARGL
jgi:outer membrane lipoprotein-sorting protein